LIESTCNQVNQYGGYTGQTPLDFMKVLRQVAEKHQFPLHRLIVGGDHLGPNPWRNESADRAMEKSRILVRDYIRAGYTKIHIDTSMKCADDGRHQPLPTGIIAARTAELVRVAEESYGDVSDASSQPLYVIGTEVPAPGGVDDEEEGQPVVTTPQATEETITATREAFETLGLEAAWERVIAAVVQPGVEYGNESLYDYDSEAAASLSRFIEDVEGFVFEAHSTDYQTRTALGELVRDHFAILKVGPALTFAFREAVFALAQIEEAWLSGNGNFALSNIRQVVDRAMTDNPIYWQAYYPGSARKKQYARQFSLSDRIRYYWPVPEVQVALDQLLDNLSVAPIPLPLLSQYFPEQFRVLRESRIPKVPREFIEYKIVKILEDYSYACGQML
jgi:D-tagatose-1,6-bisphosphate aldolase subunit GatZ/KbaZ